MIDIKDGKKLKATNFHWKAQSTDNFSIIILQLILTLAKDIVWLMGIILDSSLFNILYLLSIHFLHYCYHVSLRDN